MDGYNEQRTNASNRNFASSFRGNGYPPISEERYLVSPQHHDAAAVGSFSSWPQASFSMYDEQSQGSPVRMNMTNCAQNTIFTPEHGCMPAFNNNGMSYTSDFSSESVAAGAITNQRNMNRMPEYDNRSMSGTSNINDQSMYVGPDMWNKNMNLNSGFGGRGTFPETDFDNAGEMLNRTQNTGVFPMPPMSGVTRPRMNDFPRPPMSGVPRPRMNGVPRPPMNSVPRLPMSGVPRPSISDTPRPPMNGAPRPPMNGIIRAPMNGVCRPPMDGICSPQMNGFTRPPLNAVRPQMNVIRPRMNGIGRPPMNAICRPPVNNVGSTFFRPQMSNAPRPVNNSVVSLPQFNGNQMPRMWPPPPQMQFCNGTNQRLPKSFGWNQGTNSFARQEQYISQGDSLQNESFVVSPQSKRSKPQRKKLRKNDIFSSELKNEGNTMKPWMTEELYAEVKKKNEMFVKAKAGNSDELWQEFKLQRNKVSSLIKEAKLKNGFAIRKKKDKENESTAKPFSCDTCDRAFAFESKLEEHLKEHRKCGIEGCQFEAHPKVVELHKKMQHDTGYAAMISKLDDVAEIEKWRQQRKSHFPTFENVKKRQAEQAEKIARGEVLVTKEFGKFKKQRKGGQDDPCDSQTSVNQKSHRGRRKPRNRRQKYGNGFSVEDTKTMQSSQGDIVSDSDDDSHIMLKKFPGTSAFLTVNCTDIQDSFTSVQDTEARQKSDFKHTGAIESRTVHCTPMQDFSQEQAQSQHPLCSTVPDPQTLSCETAVPELSEELTSLKAQSHHQSRDYSSKSGHLSCFISGQEVNAGDDDAGPAVEPVVKEIEATCCVMDFKHESPEGVKSVDDDSPSVEPVVKEVERTCCIMDFKQASHGEDPKEITKSTKNAVQLKSRAKERDQNPQQSRKLNKESTQVKDNTLLEKLLADDIRYERNVILQCIRYTVNNNFFGVAGQRIPKS